MPKHNAGLLALRDRETARRPDRSQASCPVFAHPSHQHAQGLRPELLGHAVEQHIHRRPVAIHRLSSLFSITTLPSGSLFTLICRFPGQMSARPATSRSPDCASFTRIGTTLIEPLGEQFRETVRHVLYHQDAARKFHGQFREQVLQGVRPTGRDADGYDVRRRDRASACSAGSLGVSTGRNWALYARVHRCRLDFLRQFAGNFAHVREAVFRFGHEIESHPELEPSSVIAAPAVLCELTTMTGTCQRRMISFSVSIPFSPGISRSRVTDVRRQFFDLLQGKIAVNRGAYHLDRVGPVRGSAESSCASGPSHPPPAPAPAFSCQTTSRAPGSQVSCSDTSRRRHHARQQAGHPRPVCIHTRVREAIR